MCWHFIGARKAKRQMKKAKIATNENPLKQTLTEPNLQKKLQFCNWFNGTEWWMAEWSQEATHSFIWCAHRALELNSLDSHSASPRATVQITLTVPFCCCCSCCYEFSPSTPSSSWSSPPSIVNLLCVFDFSVQADRLCNNKIRILKQKRSTCV